ncbi:MAG: hypothetical protein WCW52_00525 [Elusimicrobiales bacterium]|jgi:hypothetical protein
MTGENKSDEDRGSRASFFLPKGPGSYKWTGLALVLVFLSVGGFVAWVAMKNAADKLAGGGNYNQLSANSAAPGSGPAAKAEKEGEFFASEEELAKADPALKKELLDGSAGASGAAAPGTAGPAGGAGTGDPSSGAGGFVAHSQAPRSGSDGKLLVKEITLGRLNGGRTSGTAELRPEETKGNAPARLAQSKSGAPGGAAGGPKVSVMEALKSAFKANLYGARLASQDAARGWIAKTFDANSDAAYSLVYDEKVKAKLDRVDPRSIPKFLREQDLNASDARTLGVSAVGKPELDAEGTKESLKGDKDYQDKKASRSLAKALFTPLGPFTGSGGAGDGASADKAESGGFADPDAAQTLQNIGLEDYVATEGYGAECGCTAKAPCCCLPPNSLNAQQCPEYGPFLPTDPCSPGYNAGGASGDFPVSGADRI